MFNDKLAAKMVAQFPTHRPQLDRFDLEAEAEANAIRNGSRPTFKGKRLQNKAPSRQALRA